VQGLGRRILWFAFLGTSVFVFTLSAAIAAKIKIHMTRKSRAERIAGMAPTRVAIITCRINGSGSRKNIAFPALDGSHHSLQRIMVWDSSEPAENHGLGFIRTCRVLILLTKRKTRSTLKSLKIGRSASENMSISDSKTTEKSKAFQTSPK
jgi:hypothetical protein